MIVWMLLFLLIALVLAIGIERLIARLGVENKESSPRGLALLAERLEQWSSERKRRN